MPPATIKNVLLTGPPGCGKTTVIRQVVDRLGELRLAGFYTQEIRQQGQRVGFEAIGLDGQATRLAHADFRSSHHVGRYGVDVGGFEAILREELVRPADSVDIFVIDEIGKMECLSRVFAEIVTRVLDSPVPVLATIAAKGGGVHRRRQVPTGCRGDHRLHKQSRQAGRGIGLSVPVAMMRPSQVAAA